MIRSLLFVTAVLGAATACNAAPRLDPLFGDHALIQRDRPIVVTGTAEPREAVVVTLGRARATVRAGADGRFAAILPAQGAGGPYVLAATAPSGRAEAKDVLLGDLFLCSGQSNMEFPVARSQGAPAADDRLRLFTIRHRTALSPEATLGEVTPWAASSADSARDFSAVCLFMAQQLRKAAGVPVGAIHASWGGTQIAAWMGEAAQRSTGRGAQADLLALYRRDPAAAAREAGRPWESWWRAATGDRPGAEPWQPTAVLAWAPVPRVGPWEEYGDPRLAAYDGMVWFRRDVTLDAAQARQPARLEVGAVDDADQSWVNGVPVGSGGNPGEPRSYVLAPGVLKPGANAIVVNANDVWGQGGMRGPADRMRLVFADGSVVPLDSGWRYAVPAQIPAGSPPRAPWDDIAGAGVIYNAMVAPLGRIGLKGVAWYQGESDVGIPGYADRLRAMMTDWRRQFGAPDLPFMVVQLPNYGPFATAPVESGWAAMRDEQRRAAAADGHAGLAVTLDLGDPRDLHPAAKPEVGRRAALAMATVAYGAAPAGPAVVGATRTADGGARVSFAGVAGALATRGAGQAIGFELCGAGAGSCRAVPGSVSGSAVTLAGDGRPATRVRYAWADSPTVNLVDAAGLPPGSFEVPIG